MSLLPIVERELRIASRRPGTYRMRSLLALGVVVIWFLLLVTGNSAVPKGPVLFVAIGVLALAFGMLSGIFLTADCLSEEKREGTLGLLFLTDLEGYDVVLGKLLATSTHAIYGLLAMLPVLALPLLMGGVTVGEFWRVTLVLLVSLFLSLSVGMVVSSFSTETRQAMAGTLFLMLILAGILPLVSMLQRWATSRLHLDWLAWGSPPYLYSMSFERVFRTNFGAGQFWHSLLTMALVALAALVGASLYLPRAWHAKGTDAAPAGIDGWRWRWRFGSAEFQSRWRRQLLTNPFLWLAGRDRLAQGTVWGLLAPLFVVWMCFVPGCFSSRATTVQMCFTSVMLTAFAMHQVLKCLMAAEASRRMSEDARSGALELLLVSPLPIGKILAGQRLAMWEMFRGPMLLLTFVNVVLFWFIVLRDQLRMPSEARIFFSEVCLGGAVMVFLDFYAINRVGMWLALRTRKHHRAIMATMGRISLGPWLGIMFLFFLSLGGAGMRAGTMILLAAVWFVACIVIDLAFAANADWELITRMREVCSGARPSPAAVSLSTAKRGLQSTVSFNLRKI